MNIEACEQDNEDTDNGTRTSDHSAPLYSTLLLLYSALLCSRAQCRCLVCLEPHDGDRGVAIISPTLGRRCLGRPPYATSGSTRPLEPPVVCATILLRLCQEIFTDLYRFLPIFRTFLGDFNPQKLPSRRI